MRSWFLFVLLAAATVGAFAGDGDAPAMADAQLIPRARPVALAPNALLPKADIRTDTNIVLVPVSVTDLLNRSVTGLDKDSFEVFEDKVKQEIISFGCEDAPMSLGIVFDTSGSMGPKLERARSAVAEFFKTSNPQDEAFLVEFSDRPQLAVPFTHDLNEIQNKLLSARPKGKTALFDSIYLALNTLKKASNSRKAILLITDGGDNRSRYTQAEVTGILEESDAQLYAIGIYESVRKRNRTPEEKAGPKVLSDLTDATGGRHFIVENLTDLPDIATKIGLELHNQYVVGYTPSNPVRDGKHRKISVKLAQPTGYPPLFAYWRTGYIAPTQ